MQGKQSKDWVSNLYKYLSGHTLNLTSYGDTNDVAGVTVLGNIYKARFLPASHGLS